MKTAMEHARAGKGPYVVEAKVYRYQGHYCGDPAVYRPKEYMEHALANDGIEKLGKRLTVLCEGFDPVSETHYGRSYADAPEIDGKIFFTAEHRINDGEFVTVKITDVLDYDLYGKVVSE